MGQNFRIRIHIQCNWIYNTENPKFLGLVLFFIASYCSLRYLLNNCRKDSLLMNMAVLPVEQSGPGWRGTATPRGGAAPKDSPKMRARKESSRQYFSMLEVELIHRGYWLSVAKPSLFWAAPAPDGQGPGADSGSDLLGSASAPGKKRRLQAAPAPSPAPYTNIFHFKLSKS